MSRSNNYCAKTALQRICGAAGQSRSPQKPRCKECAKNAQKPPKNFWHSSAIAKSQIKQWPAITV